MTTAVSAAGSAAASPVLSVRCRVAERPRRQAAVDVTEAVVLGQRAHWVIGRLAFVTMAVLTVLGFLWYGSPSGFLYTVLLGVMLKVRHPQPLEMEPLGRIRIGIAIITLIVFALCFWPFPITIS